MAPSFGVELSPVGVRDAGEIERTIAAFARFSNAGMIVTASTSAVIHRHLFVMLAARHRLPALLARADEVIEWLGIYCPHGSPAHETAASLFAGSARWAA